jgi:hypothetical protein
MNKTTDVFVVTEAIMAVLYLWALVRAVLYLWRCRTECFTCTSRQAWLRSGLLAFVITPSVITDFWLFLFPIPAALGFFLVLPWFLLGVPRPLWLLAAILALYALPWIACSALIYGVWRVIHDRRERLSMRSSEPPSAGAAGSRSP